MILVFKLNIVALGIDAAQYIKKDIAPLYCQAPNKYHCRSDVIVAQVLDKT